MTGAIPELSAGIHRKFRVIMKVNPVCHQAHFTYTANSLQKHSGIDWRVLMLSMFCPTGERNAGEMVTGEGRSFGQGFSVPAIANREPV
jgi:hypothetical protein